MLVLEKRELQNAFKLATCKVNMRIPLPRIKVVPWAMITPVYNESEYITPMIESVLAQTIQPSKWVIVDDGSTDNTVEIIKSYSKRYDFIEIIERPRREQREPGGEGAIEHGLERLNLRDYDFLARFDADLIFGSSYIEQIVGEFERDEQLGIAGGCLYIEKNGDIELEVAPTYHVRGALKMYRRKCFEQIGGLSASIGWDTIDEVYAWMCGWKTRSFSQYRVLHCRPTGSGINASRVLWERGKAEFNSCSSPLFVLIKTMKIAVHGLAALQAMSFLGGFVWCYLTRQPRIQDPLFVKTRRNQQLKRLIKSLSIPGLRSTDLAITERGF